MIWAEMTFRQKHLAVGPLLKRGITPSVIDEMLGAPRGAVRGLLEKPEPDYRARKKDAPTSQKKEIEKTHSSVWDPLPGSRPVPLLQVCGCKWPVGNGLFCNDPKDDRRYCKTHRKISNGTTPSKAPSR